MKVVLSGMFTDLRGQLGNAVASKNKQGNFFRTRVIPHQFQSDIYKTSKGNFGYLASYWRTMSLTDRGTWSAHALTYTFYDQLGNPFTPSGYQLFIFINQRWLMTGSSLITTPADYLACPTPSLDLTTFNHVGPLWQIKFFSFPSSDYLCLHYVSKPWPQDANRHTWPVVYFAKYIYPSSVYSNIAPAYNSFFGITPVSGQVIYSEFVYININNGNIGFIRNEASSVI
jgi:hypothetical protein